MNYKLTLGLPITKKRLSKLACIHINTMTKWCSWSYPALKRTGYKPRNRELTIVQVLIIWEIARNKYSMIYFRKNKKRDSRVFSNKWLFPNI